MRTTFALLAALALAFTPACASSNANADKSNDTAKTATTSEVAVYDWAQTEQAVAAGAVIVDARSPASYENGHIAGAINVPCKDDSAFANLPADKNTQLVFYCGGPACSASNKAASAAAAKGYTRVAEYKGGYPEWAKANGIEVKPAARAAVDGIPVLAWADVQAAVNGGALLVDARSAESFQKGHIAGAINVPYKDDAAYAGLPQDKAKQLIFYCGGPACSASTKCATTARDKGYSTVAEYRGGYPEWEKAQAAQPAE